jgi:hypothetical protein
MSEKDFCVGCESYINPMLSQTITTLAHDQKLCGKCSESYEELRNEENTDTRKNNKPIL